MKDTMKDMSEVYENFLKSSLLHKLPCAKIKHMLQNDIHYARTSFSKIIKRYTQAIRRAWEKNAHTCPHDAPLTPPPPPLLFLQKSCKVNPFISP